MMMKWGVRLEIPVGKFWREELVSKSGGSYKIKWTTQHDKIIKRTVS
jgi:hypothetical protein